MEDYHRRKKQNKNIQHKISETIVYEYLKTFLKREISVRTYQIHTVRRTTQQGNVWVSPRLKSSCWNQIRLRVGGQELYTGVYVLHTTRRRAIENALEGKKT